MLLLIFTIMLILWLFGMINGYTFEGFLHLLLLIAVTAIIIRILQGRRAI